MKTKRNELNKLKEAVETEDEVLQKLVSSVNKHKTELKHTKSGNFLFFYIQLNLSIKDTQGNLKMCPL
jgi:hypothetical protein